MPLGVLCRMIELNKVVWRNEDFARKATKLRDEIRSGIEKFGIIDLGNEYVLGLCNHSCDASLVVGIENLDTIDLGDE
jgi:hypothetical protein